jgi:uncharacterized protein (DUF924 family)
MDRLATADEVIGFWRAAGPERWFAPDAAFDETCRTRFLLTHEAAARGDLNEWELTPESRSGGFMSFEKLLPCGAS